MDDSSNGRVVALYPVDPGSNPRSGSVWDHFVSATHIIYVLYLSFSPKASKGKNNALLPTLPFKCKEIFLK